MWDLIVSVPEHCLSFYFTILFVFFFFFFYDRMIVGQKKVFKRKCLGVRYRILRLVV